MTPTRPTFQEEYKRNIAFWCNGWFVRNLPAHQYHSPPSCGASQQIMLGRNMNLTYPIADLYMSIDDPDRGLLNRYNRRIVKRDFAPDQGDDLDARAKAA